MTREEAHPEVVRGEVVGADDAAHAASTDVVAYDKALFPDLLAVDPASIRERFARRFMAAETLEQLFDVLSGNTALKLVGRRLEIEQVAWAPFESDRGIIPNAICQAVDLETGEVIEFATTSEALTMFIRRAEVVGAMPFKVKIASVKTKGGNTALNFERV
jgi:hypothetical protein